ncbi:hypothetical protein RHSIM_Rhsim09G0182300 [Rhododendron simsii]|uniref:Alpha-soluble NSF attachment protein n=1 Tax=Rhododendron simsii TaxID=118357 RepID=A0A834LEF3_RHOSS|nr:hypothetical protein RHSIM_Rhsim09G0182300 [Rhododendron simsii]
MTGSPRSQSYCTIKEVALLYSLQGLRIRADHPSKPRTQRRRETMLLAILSSALIIYAVYITVRMLLPLSPPRKEAPAGTTAEHRKRGEDWEKKAEGSLSHWALYNFFTLGHFSSKYEEVAARLFDKAAIAFKLAESWDQAGSAYMKLANCRLKMDMTYEAGLAYVDAANCYKKTNCKESISCLEQAVNLFLRVGHLLIAAANYKEIAKLYEAEQNFDQAIVYYERAADLFHSEEETFSLKECRGETTELFNKSAIAFKLGKSWDQAGSAYIKLANYYLKMDMKYEAGTAYVDAANCYKEINCKESISCLEQAVNLFLGVGQLLISAVNYKEIAELYEAEQNFDQAIVYYERAADLFHSEENTRSLEDCCSKTAGLFNKAAIAFKLAKSWDQAGSAYVKLANYYLKMDMKYEAGTAYVDAADCYKKINSKESISCLEQAVNLFLGVGRLLISAVNYKEIAELYEAEQNFDQAIVYYERAADLFHSEENTGSVQMCWQKTAGLFNKAAIAFKLAKSWDQAGSAYVKLANCYLKMDIKYTAGSAYVDAANCYKKTNCKESISCLEQAVNLFLGDGELYISAVKYEEIAKLYEAEQNFDRAIVYYERAADLFHSEEMTEFLNRCRGKIAQFAAQLEDYQKSIEIYEDMARQSLSDNWSYEAKELLLLAGICQLCKGKGDVVTINKSFDRYQDLDPTFSGTREYKLLADLADAVDQEDIAKFTDAIKEFNRMNPMTQLDAWTTTLLSRVKEALNAKELSDDDLS